MLIFFRKGDCVNVDCLNTHALFAPKAKPLKIWNQMKDKVRMIIWPLISEYEKLYLNSQESLSGLKGLQVADILIDRSLKLLAVCASSSSFQVFFRSKASQVPARLVRCHYVLHVFALSLIGSLINRGDSFCMAILSVLQ